MEIGVEKASSLERVVVMGGSSGGTAALIAILQKILIGFSWPIIVVQHLHRTDGGRFAEHLASRCLRPVREAVDKMVVQSAEVYTAPAEYHLLLERDATLSLSLDAPVNWARPSIDVLFESAAYAFGERIIGVILSGANEDGALGMKKIKELGGVCIAQDPASAECAEMPRAAISRAGIECVLDAEAIGDRLLSLETNRIQEVMP